MEDYYAKCRECKKFGTYDCPNSSQCFAIDDKPYFEQKEKDSEWKQFIRWIKRMKRSLLNQ